MVAVLFDTCILIDYLKGLPDARTEIENAGTAGSMSVVSWMEVLAGAPAGSDDGTRSFLQRFQLLQLDSEIAEVAVRIRRERRLKLPDAIILATSLSRKLTLVTRDERAFGPESIGVRIPYRV